jgi:hypothetical protein
MKCDYLTGLSPFFEAEYPTLRKSQIEMSGDPQLKPNGSVSLAELPGRDLPIDCPKQQLLKLTRQQD